VVIVDLIGFGIVMPVLPFYAVEFGASATVLGLLMMVYAAAQFVFAPLWGRLSDRIGRRPVMLMTVAGTAFSLLALGLAPSLPWLFAARVLGGAFAANISVASAYITDVTAEEERTRWMGLLGASFGIGFLLGPAIGGALAPFGYSVPLLVAAGIAALNWAHAWISLQEPPRHASDDGEAPRGRIAPLRDPLVRRLCAANGVFSVAVAQLETIFALYMMDRFDYDAQHVAAILVGMALLMGGVQGSGMKPLAARFSERGLAIGGSLVLGVAFVLMPEMSSVAWLLGPLALSALGRAVLQPSLLSMTSFAATPRERGSVMGAFQASASLARVVGPVVAGLLYDVARPAPFWFAGVMLLTTAVLAQGLPRREPDNPLAAAGAAR
jgi:DHA1 family tetracycline resistance protein-like MFS transporter